MIFANREMKRASERQRKAPIVMRPITLAELRKLEREAEARRARRASVAAWSVIGCALGGAFVVFAWAMINLAGGRL